MRLGVQRGVRLVLLLAAATAVYPCAHAQTKSEYQIKAALLYNFARFTQWQEPAQPANLSICVVGNESVADEMRATLKDQRIGDRPVELKRVRSAAEANRCQVLFFAAGAMNEAKSMLATGLHAGVLTVGETESFLPMGGVINFFLENDRVRFEVNLAASQRQKLTLSARMLSLAKSVHQQAKGAF